MRYPREEFQLEHSTAWTPLCAYPAEYSSTEACISFWPWPRGPWAEPWPWLWQQGAQEASDKGSLIQPGKKGLTYNARTMLMKNNPGGDRREFVCFCTGSSNVLYRIHYRIHHGSRSDPGPFYRIHPCTTCIIARKVGIFQADPARALTLI